MRKLTPVEILEDCVMQLHTVAHHVSEHVGTGKLTDDIRNCADRLSKLLRPLDTEKKGDKNV
jgi:hypothetical protein